MAAAMSKLATGSSQVQPNHGIPKADVKRILARMETLRDDPRAPGCDKLSGAELYRVRQGVYRIVYEIHDAWIVVEVIRVGHRSEVYRRS